MVNIEIKNIYPERWFYIFMIMHVIVWTLAPILVRFNLPLDAMEGTTWGRQLEWGYDKNPFFGGWITELAVTMHGSSGWTIYLFSQISIALCFWAVWQFGKKLLPACYALIAVLLLEAIQYYNLHAIDFNDNTLEVGLWALTILFFYQALTTNKLRDWLLTGLFAGLGMMTKYYTVMLLFPMLMMLLFNSDARQAFKKPPVYAGLLLFLAIMTPNIIWLFKHDFVALDYALERVSPQTPTWFNHLFFPAEFSIQQFGTVLPALFLALTLYIGKPMQLHPKIRVKQFDKEFLFFMGFAPFLLTIILSVLIGSKLRAAWGQPLFSLVGITLILWLQPQLTLKKFYRFVVILFSLLALMLTIYCVGHIRATEPSSANYPGKIIARELTTIWHKKYNTSVKYVAGSRWLAGNIAFYSTDRPVVYIDWNKRLSPWIDEDALKQHGAIFVWDLWRKTHGDQASLKDIQARFPKLSQPELMRYRWYRNENTPPFEILVAYLAPSPE